MRMIPTDLSMLNKHLQRPQGPNITQAGWASAFLRICKELEEGLVMSDEDRVTWLQDLGTLEFNLLKVQIGDHVKGLAIKPATFESLEDVASRSWRGPSKLLRTLPFVADKEYRNIAERDLTAIPTMQKAEETKSAILLAGSVIEAVLLDLAEGEPDESKKAATALKTKREAKDNRWHNFKPSDIDNWTFYQLVAVHGPDGRNILSKRTELIANTARDIRNLVHPRSERSELKTNRLRPADATVAVALMDLVLEEVRNWSNARSQSA